MRVRSAHRRSRPRTNTWYLKSTNVTDNPDSEHYVDIEHDGDILVSVDAHNGDPPTVSIFQPGEPEDALLSVQFDEDGEINSWRE